MIAYCVVVPCNLLHGIHGSLFHATSCMQHETKQHAIIHSATCCIQSCKLYVGFYAFPFSVLHAYIHLHTNLNVFLLGSNGVWTSKSMMPATTTISVSNLLQLIGINTKALCLFSTHKHVHEWRYTQHCDSKKKRWSVVILQLKHPFVIYCEINVQIDSRNTLLIKEPPPGKLLVNICTSCIWKLLCIYMPGGVLTYTCLNLPTDWRKWT